MRYILRRAAEFNVAYRICDARLRVAKFCSIKHTGGIYILTVKKVVNKKQFNRFFQGGHIDLKRGGERERERTN